MKIAAFSAISIALIGQCLFSAGLQADSPQPVISIIIDDLGYNRSEAESVLQLPLAVTLSILPFTPYSREISQRAGDQGREYMLHLPMQGHEQENSDPGMLTRSMSDDEFVQSLRANLQALSGYSGINNHKGSELTADRGKMNLLFNILSADKSIFFVDSKTTATSKIAPIASQLRLPFASRNIFLDVDKSELAIKNQIDRLLDIAREYGSAIAIGHPYPSTLAVLDRFFAGGEYADFELVPVRQLIERRNRRRELITVTNSHQKISPISN